MSDYFLSTAILVHLAAITQVTGYLLKDQIQLRLFLLAGNVLYGLYYVLHPATPLWDAMAWSCVMVAANTVLICVILRERRQGRLDSVEQEIYRQLGAPLPGHFRRIMKAARRVSTDTTTTLVSLNEQPRKLFYVYRGPCVIDLPASAPITSDGGFIGELSLVLDQAANATVTLPTGGQYLEWDRADLAALFAASPQIRLSFEQLLTRDIARKLAQKSIRQHVTEITKKRA